jgi:hypothetical protein
MGGIVSILRADVFYTERVSPQQRARQALPTLQPYTACLHIYEHRILLYEVYYVD